MNPVSMNPVSMNPVSMNNGAFQITILSLRVLKNRYGREIPWEELLSLIL